MSIDEPCSEHGAGRAQNDHTMEHEETHVPATQARQGTQDQHQQARDAVYRLLAARARSEFELTQALFRKGIEEEVAHIVIRKFVDAGLVDDFEFAKTWVSSRHEHLGLGRSALSFELRRKGVSESARTAALSGVDEDSEEERARELVRRKLRSMHSVDKTARTRRLVGMLARKGYSEGLAFRVVREENERSGNEREFDSDDEAF